MGVALSSVGMVGADAAMSASIASMLISSDKEGGRMFAQLPNACVKADAKCLDLVQTPSVVAVAWWHGLLP